jgi:single-strand DNA-binding protein
MARSINKAVLLGNLTRDPVLRYTASGKPVCDFGIATNRAFTNDKGERQELPEFHNIVAWGKLAEIVSQYLAKGRKVYLEGRLQTRSYETADGQQKSRTEIVASDLVMLDSRGAGATTIGHNGKTQPNGETHETPQAEDPTLDTAFSEAEINPEEIPF